MSCTPPAALQFLTQDPADGTPVKEVAPFLRSLRLMLNTENPRILRWTMDGKAFEIHDMAAMARHVLPKYFKHRKYASFQRQLNYFHFRKWTKSRAIVCTFSNQFFQRDQPALTWHITRKRSLSPTKNTLFRSSSVKEDGRAPLALMAPDLQLSRQLNPVKQTTLEPDTIDGDASLAWVDALYPELELDLLDDSDPTSTNCYLLTEPLWL
uniref:HSF-type DNA-binding domain-containing protein n=1 Tax=Hyaloperonospora arabidopsidis (strain Emoy2) TaxID=559515 RepID=M4B9J1_HYAAE